VNVLRKTSVVYDHKDVIANDGFIAYSLDHSVNGVYNLQEKDRVKCNVKADCRSVLQYLG
jgi:hypothetical protein